MLIVGDPGTPYWIKTKDDGKEEFLNKDEDEDHERELINVATQ